MFVCLFVCLFFSSSFFQFNCHDCFSGVVYFLTAFTLGLIKGRPIYHCEFRDFIPLLDSGLMLSKNVCFLFVRFCFVLSFCFVWFLFCVGGWVCVFFFDCWKLFNFEKLCLGLFFLFVSSFG